ncbi:MAG: ABC transporter substrate-binding protein [Anaerolineae bacterium]|nr:ABC transporter substrate-binding protein [Anaerolineae bacterium]
MRKSRLTRRDFVRKSALAAAGAVVVGCAPATPQVVEKEVTREVVKEVEKVVTVAPGPTEKVQVSFWSELVGSKEEGRAALLSAFNAASDDIEVVHEPTFGSDETAQKFLTAVSGGIVPDLLGNEADYIPGYAEIDALTDLGPFMEASETVKIDSFPRGVISLCMYDNKVWGIPVYADTMVLYYNKNLLAEAGFDPEQPPRDWDSFREAAIATSKRDASGKLLVSGVGIGAWSGPRVFMPWLYAWGGRMYNDDLTKAEFNSPEGKEVLNNLVKLIYEDKVTDFGWGEEFEDSVNEPFIAETMAMTFDVPAATRRIVRWRPEFQNWGLVGLPAGPKGFAQIASACALMIPKNAKHPKEAWRVIEYWMQPKVMVRWAKDIFRPPSTLAAMEDESVMQDPRIAPVTEALQYTVEMPQTTKYGEIFNTLSAEIELALVGDKSADQALDDAAAAVDQILARP